MLCRFKGSRSFEDADRKTLAEFLKLNTTESGTLKDPLEIVLTGFLGKQTASEDNSFPWVFSTNDCDRFDERVDPKGWELERYLENPVVLWAHCHSIPAIGIADRLTATDKLAGRIKFNAKEIDEFGWSIGERVKAGVIRAGSVGMLVKEIEWIDHKKNPRSLATSSSGSRNFWNFQSVSPANCLRCKRICSRNRTSRFLHGS